MSINQHLLSGALSGLSSVLCLQPFDLLKTRIQQTDVHNAASAPQKRAVLSIAKNIITENGVLGLWRGTTPTLLRNVPGVALYFTSLQYLRATLSQTPYFQKHANASAGHQRSSTLPLLSSKGNLIAGASARTAVGFILNPVTVVKARYESDIHAFKNLGEALKDVFRGGPRELLKGAGASALRDAPYAGLFLFCYEGIKRDLERRRVGTASLSTSTISHAAAGAAAGTFATLVTHPFDVLKTKIQVRPESRYGTIQSAAMSIWRRRGPLGFFDGVSLRLSRKVLSSAIGWAVYEGVLLVIQNQ